MLVNKRAYFVNAANINKCIERNPIEKEFLYKENMWATANGFWYVVHCPWSTVSGFW